ncbi:hypothetical protein ANN_24701 [Periplaneta americana]|uniref:E1A-binding protein p400 N-terminal domain-containing protein n=1 Tax=Periplaneta americana TaxID=6978 RepID=A0ABQ8RZZ2_PERAM|nr:hypothetical protein ANN_24701 [Periplaneta americana]
MLRKIFGAERDEVTREWRKLRSAELHALYSSPDIIRNIKSRCLRWAGHVALMGESRNAYRVIPTIATSNAALQQAGVTRILNIAPSPRVNVVGVSQVPGRGGTLQLAANNAAGNNSTSDSAGRGTVSLVAIGQPAVNASSHPTLSPPPTLVLTSTPNLVRTSSGSFATPLSSTSNLMSSAQSSPARKRMRLSDLHEKPPPNEEIAALRKKVLEHKMSKMRSDREKYAEHASELFFCKLEET